MEIHRNARRPEPAQLTYARDAVLVLHLSGTAMPRQKRPFVQTFSSICTFIGGSEAEGLDDMIGHTAKKMDDHVGCFQRDTCISAASVDGNGQVFDTKISMYATSSTVLKTLEAHANFVEGHQCNLVLMHWYDLLYKVEVPLHDLVRNFNVLFTDNTNGLSDLPFGYMFYQSLYTLHEVMKAKGRTWPETFKSFGKIGPLVVLDTDTQFQTERFQGKEEYEAGLADPQAAREDFKSNAKEVLNKFKSLSDAIKENIVDTMWKDGRFGLRVDIPESEAGPSEPSTPPRRVRTRS